MSDDVISWSHTSMSTFETCPRQYEAKYVTKEVKFEETEATRWGNEVHQGLEEFVRDGTPLPPNVAIYEKYGRAILARRGEKVIEGAFGLTVDKTPTDFFAKDVWVRSKIDVLILRDDGIAEVFDWKTGKPKLDATQLLLYSLLVLEHYPEINEVRCAYVWLKNQSPIAAPISYRRVDKDGLWRTFEDKYRLLKSAYDLGVFQPKTSGLCAGWCSVKSCEFWKPPRAKR